ncbi:MAG TPA: RHS repeat-associated core domain-containing protein [Pseudomonas sp.]|nr:RHS repeat-associated core domain-containing protein [Pseudomonas sp.]
MSALRPRTSLTIYDYEPYGGVVGGQVTDGPGYTGHVSDSATGLSYMQQRYMDPQLGMFLSVDPVTAYEQPVEQFNRYRYANGNPYRFTDPDGRLSRGTGWTERQWNQFDRAQQSAAGSLEKAAGKITGAMAEGDKSLQRAEKAFERNFGAGSATAENMSKAASDMSSMAAALRDTSAGAIPANGMTGAQITATYGGGGNTLAGVPTTGPKMVIVNTTHASFSDSSKLAWGVGHETGHAVLGYKDQFFNGDTAYKFGTPQQQNMFKTLPSEQRLINPDHIMDQAR